ncbi:MAG: hypothetical protein ABSC63_20180 [Candidatus Binataceae bacterium]|jgi:hypothetical protein
MKRTWLLFVVMTVTVAGCGGSGGNSPAPPPASTFSNATNASLEAIDCKRELAYVPVVPSGTPNATVAVLNLAVDPDTTNPLVTLVNLGHGGEARGSAIAAKQGLALIISGSVVATGFLDEINESDNSIVSGSPFSFPIGSRPLTSDGIVSDPIHNSALVSMISTPVTCPGGSSTACTGMASFNLGSNSFGALFQFNTSVSNFGLDPMAQVSLGPSDPIDPLMYAINVGGSAACTLSDDSVATLNGDAEGAAVDPTTGIWVIGNFVDPFTTIINLRGAAFAGTPPNCTLNEFGAPPSNSLNFDTGADDFLPGVAINPVTHEAVLVGLLDNTVALISLPKTPEKFISDSHFSAVNSVLPLEPDGVQFEASVLPYSVAIDTCHNRAYIVNSNETFMAEVDLDKLKTDPGAIATALPAGNCAGTSTTLACDNENGVRFFPLPTSVSAGEKIPQ